MRQAKSTHKQRRTFTLSPASLAYLQHETRRRKADSQSSVLDELLLEKTREQKLAEIEANITAYYDNLTDAEVEEQRTWAQFAEQTLVLSEEELAHAQSATRGDLVHKTPNRSSGKRKAPGRHRIGRPAKPASAS